MTLTRLKINKIILSENNYRDHCEISLKIENIIENNEIFISDANICEKVIETSLKLEFSLDKLIFSFSDADIMFSVSLQNIYRLLKDYDIICKSIENISEMHDYNKVASLDVVRRSIHNETSEELMDLISKFVKIDFLTCRNIVSLIYLYKY